MASSCVAVESVISSGIARAGGSTTSTAAPMAEKPNPDRPLASAATQRVSVTNAIETKDWPAGRSSRLISQPFTRWITAGFRLAGMRPAIPEYR